MRPRAEGDIAVLLLVAMVAGCSTPEQVERTDALTPPQAFLWTHPYPKLALEIYHAPGLATSRLALDALLDALTNMTGKEVASVQQFDLTGPAAEKRERTSEELTALAAEHSQYTLGPGEYGHNDTAVLHIYYLLGDHVDGAFGLHVDGRVFLFFDETDPSTARPLMEQKAERRVLIHETGHAVGLVNTGIPMVTPRENPDSPGHSTNPDSVMSVGQFKLWPPDPARVLEDRIIPYQFDADDVADVMAFRASEPRRAT